MQTKATLTQSENDYSRLNSHWWMEIVMNNLGNSKRVILNYPIFASSNKWAAYGILGINKLLCLSSIRVLHPTVGICHLQLLVPIKKIILHCILNHFESSEWQLKDEFNLQDKPHVREDSLRLNRLALVMDTQTWPSSMKNDLKSKNNWKNTSFN